MYALYLQARYEEMLQQKAELQKQLQKLKGQASVGNTPVKADDHMKQHVQSQQEYLDVLMGLQVSPCNHYFTVNSVIGF